MSYRTQNMSFGGVSRGRSKFPPNKHPRPRQSPPTDDRPRSPRSGNRDAHQGVWNNHKQRSTYHGGYASSGHGAYTRPHGRDSEHRDLTRELTRVPPHAPLYEQIKEKSVPRYGDGMDSRRGNPHRMSPLKKKIHPPDHREKHVQNPRRIEESRSISRSQQSPSPRHPNGRESSSPPSSTFRKSTDRSPSAVESSRKPQTPETSEKPLPPKSVQDAELEYSEVSSQDDEDGIFDEERDRLLPSWNDCLSIT